MGARHERLWEWFESLRPGARPRPRVDIWPRGGGKSTSVELGCARCCVKLSRRYVLYVSETQPQADKHVQAVASLLEVIGGKRAVNQYGASKGWRRQELRTANGFNVSALGLDAAIRGAKLDHFRPDLIIFDDLDSQDDTDLTRGRKVDALTTAILPAGSVDCAYLGVQNKVGEDSIFAQLADGRADFIHDREPVCEEPAVRGLAYEVVDRGDGRRVYRVTGGEPTWAGQDLAICERQINLWGLGAFLREAQHEVAGAAGVFFDTSQLRTCPPDAVPPLVSVALAWDLAATEGAGDHTVGVVIGKDAAGRFYVLAVIRGQWSSERVRACIGLAYRHYRAKYPSLRLRLPQDPAQAGKDQAEQFRRAFPGAVVEPVSGDKATRATGFAEAVNLGNVTLVEADLPEFMLQRLPETNMRALGSDGSWATWHRAYRDVLRKFQAEVREQQDDDVDASSDGFNLISPRRRTIWAA